MAVFKEISWIVVWFEEKTADFLPVACLDQFDVLESTLRFTNHLVVMESGGGGGDDDNDDNGNDGDDDGDDNNNNNNW